MLLGIEKYHFSVNLLPILTLDYLCMPNIHAYFLRFSISLRNDLVLDQSMPWLAM